MQSVASRENHGEGMSSIRETLERHGLRCTRQRLAVYDFLNRTESHPTAEEVFLAVRDQVPHISLATVYKTLDALVDRRLVVKLPDTTGSGSSRFDARAEHHYHLRCLETGRVEDLDAPFDPELPFKVIPELEDHLRRKGFIMTGYRLELHGRFAPELSALDDQGGGEGDRS